MQEEVITLDYGSGGAKTSGLVDRLFRKAFDNPELNALGDGAILPISGQEIAFSTDSFVVDPLFFPGGDIGKLAVCGTVNDVSMCGAVPLWLSLSLVIEEGLPMEILERIVASIAETAKKAGVRIVTGDTKVVERGQCDRIYLNTAGIGRVECQGLGPDRIRPGDRVLVSGPIGDHGTAVLLARNDLGLFGEIRSDCMPLNQLAKTAWDAGEIHCLRDATRGGVATTLNEFTEGRTFGICLNKRDIPVRPQVRSASEMLGLDPLYTANEGRMLCVVADADAEKVLQAMRAVPGGEESCEIGRVTEEFAGKTVLRTELGAHRILNKLTGAQLPRIC